MRRFVLILFFLFASLYAALHLALGSSPVQKRVVKELQDLLREFGVTLQMESIEFSAFAPKIYLNRVKLEASPKTGIDLSEPLSVDKIKIQFRPLALLWGKIVIDELLLFHPRVQIPRADKLYQSFVSVLNSKGAIKVERPTFDVVLYKTGVVDALFNIESINPAFSIKSRSLTVLVEKGSGQQRSVIVQSSHLEGAWGKYPIALTKVDVDVDLAADSLRLNKGTVENDEASISLVGASRFPTETEKLPRNLSLSYDAKLKLPYLAQFGAKGLMGSVEAQGTVKKENTAFSGKGSVSYADVSVDGYEVGTGSLPFYLDKQFLQVSGAAMKYAGGDFRSPRLRIELNEHFPIQGDLNYTGLLLEKILVGVGVEGTPVAMSSSGKIKVSGTFRTPFQLVAELDSKIENLLVLDDAEKAKSESNTLIQFGSGTLKGPLTFTLDKMDFDASATLLGGEVKAKGFVGFDDSSRLEATGTKISLTQLDRIANLHLGGVADLKAEIVAEADGGHVSGSFQVSDGKVADLELGTVGGDAFYQSDLLTFENLVLPSLEPVRGNGYVDFSGEGTKYKFYVNARRAETNKIFNVLRNLNLTFDIPKNGEVNTRITVEGEGSGKVRVAANGQAKNFSWFDEKWLSSNFSLTYADSAVDLQRVLLTKPSGALEAKGYFGKTDSRLSLSTFGLDLSGFDRFGEAPVTGEVAGQISFEGPRGEFLDRGKGDLKLVKAKFRGVPIPDSTLKIRPEGEGLEYLFNLGGDRLRGRFVRGNKKQKEELLLYFKEYDFAPLLTLFLSRDIPPMADLKASGDLALAGDFSDFGSLNGSGTVSDLLVGFKGTPMKMEKPAKIRMDKRGLRVESIFLKGEDSQLSVSANFESGRQIDAQLDGRMDLQYLQPFIPGVEYGTGKVSAGLRLSGPPSRYQLLGNVALESGTFRLTGFTDEFRNVDARLSLSQDRINVDKFEALMNGGPVTVDGDVRLDRFKVLSPNLKVHAEKVVMNIDDYLSGKLTADLVIRGKNRPYSISGKCELHEGSLSSFQVKSSQSSLLKSSPAFTFDIQCFGSQKLVVSTDIMQAEFKGVFHLVGDNINLGLLGSADSIKGSLLFRDTKFNLDTANVKFESPTEILPRFRVAGRANVREVSQSSSGQTTAGSDSFTEVQDYEVALQSFGTPSDYKIRLSSTPPLLEGEIISLLVLGVTKRGQQSGNLLDLGGALVGQNPIQSKLKKDLGVNIKINSQSAASLQQGSNLSPGSADTDITAPTVQIQKTITDRTKISFTNSLEVVPVREFRLEQMLDDNVTLNATTMERTRGTNTQPTQAYGLDFRYRFQFE
jgi:translocation and assembly module TamB